MKIVSKRYTETTIYHHLHYDTSPGRGYSFACDVTGRINEEELTVEGLKSLAKAKAAGIKPYLQENTSSYTHPAVGQCSCGEEVFLSNFTNTCDCGTEYNSAGQQLAHRSCWGEETGEHPADIGRIQ